MAQLCDAYLGDYAKDRKKASSLRNDRSMIVRFVKPALGARKVADVTRQDVLKRVAATLSPVAEGSPSCQAQRLNGARFHMLSSHEI